MLMEPTFSRKMCVLSTTACLASTTLKLRTWIRNNGNSLRSRLSVLKARAFPWRTSRARTQVYMLATSHMIISLCKCGIRMLCIVTMGLELRLQFWPTVSVTCSTSTVPGECIRFLHREGVLLTGAPSFTLDTACSSSIYSLHAAVSALKNGECDGAIVAASNLILTPETFVAAMKTGVLSSSSTCQTFDAQADGYGRAEGVNAIFLKRLSAALRDGHDIYAVVRGTAINS